jgi:hypothetical protein
MNIMAVTCMRNEAPYCLEWIAHHRAAGFTNFLIYTHDCTDGTDTLLDLLPGVTHVPFQSTDGKSPQWSAMKLADKHPLMKATAWAMFFDCDEFLCLAAPLTSVTDLIRSVPENTDAIALQWRLFGSSGLVDWSAGLTLERFEMAAPSDLALPAGHFFKALFQPSKFQKLGVHRPKNKKAHLPSWNLGGTVTAPHTFASDDGRINLFGLTSSPAAAWLNHYSTRSVTEFLVKRERGLPNRQSKNINLSYWAERNFNTVKDLSIQSMIHSTREVLEELQSLDGVAVHVNLGVKTHQSVFEHAMKIPKNVMFFLHLSLLSGSKSPSKMEIEQHLVRLANATDG